MVVEAKKLRQAIDDLDAYISDAGLGCGNAYCCITGKANGQHTNGSCGCVDKILRPEQVAYGRGTIKLLLMRMQAVIEAAREIASDSARQCETCYGEGWVPRKESYLDMVKCPDCGGGGKR